MTYRAPLAEMEFCAAQIIGQDRLAATELFADAAPEIRRDILDEAAKQLLRLSNTFPAFSDELRERADQIVIIRTWDFKSNRFRTKSGVS